MACDQRAGVRLKWLPQGVPRRELFGALKQPGIVRLIWQGAPTGGRMGWLSVAPLFHPVRERWFGTA